MKGLVYPLQLENGSVMTTSYYPTLVVGAIMSAIRTRTEERVFRPEYGRSDEEFNTVPNLTDVLSRVRRAVELGLEDYPDVQFEVRGRAGEDGLVELQIVYTCPEEQTNTLVITI